jgi:peptide/nickel transport system ATP-binding protein
LLDVRDLIVEYHSMRGTVRAVADVSVSLEKGSTLGLVGESGSGKSTFGFSLLRMVPPPGRIIAGQIDFDGTKLLQLSEDEIRRIRGSQISMIFQDPMTSLNPVKKIRDHFIELYRTHDPTVTKEDAVARAAKLLDSLGIGGDRIDDYPHQFSGGMRQRVMIGLALALNPKLIIADEPTTALDVIVEAQILELLKQLKTEHQLTMILITHNIGIVAEMADTIGVMYAGQLVELGPAEDIFEDPLHPYTKGLLESAPNIVHPERSMRPVPGSPPDLLSPPSGCKFHPRCPRVFELCPHKEPNLREHKRRLVACHLYD